MTINQIKTKAKYGRKPQYPDYISLDILDSVIKSGADPVEMIAQMKKALMERVCNDNYKFPKTTTIITGFLTS